MPAVRQSQLVVESGRQTSTITQASISGVAAGNMLVSVVAAHCSTSVQAGDIVSGYTSTPSNTWTLAVRSAQTIGSFRTEVTIWVAHNVAAGATTGRPSLTSGTNPGHDVWHHFDEWADMAASASVDRTGTDTEPENSGTITVPTTTTLSQAEQVVYAVAASRFNFEWNGTFAAPGSPPSGYTIAHGSTDNSLLVAQSAYREVASTAGVGASWTYATQPGDRGAVAALATLRKSTTSLRMEIDDIDVTDITGTTGWTIGAWPADPFQTGATGQCAKVWTAYAATLDGTTLIFPDAPPGASINDTYNVSGYQPAGTRQLAWCSGVVRVVT
jgi:hypothetical protein